MHGRDPAGLLPYPRDELVVPLKKPPAANLGEVGRSFCVFGVSKPREDADSCGEEDGVGSNAAHLRCWNAE